MLVRRPALNHGAIRAHWAKNHAYAQDVNASSTIPSQVEPYLIRVMRKAKENLPEHEKELRAEIDWFIAQEAQHFSVHNEFNAALIKQGYARIPEFEARLRKDYVQFLNKRSLKFNLAYSEGFECMGPVAARRWFDLSDDMLEGADPDAVLLWKWHLAEEFEHRHTIYRIYMRLFARSPWEKFWNGWLYRCYGLICAIIHLGKYSDDARAYLLSMDRATMTPDKLAQSKADEKIANQHRARTMSAILECLSPFHSPDHFPEPTGMQDYLAQIPLAKPA